MGRFLTRVQQHPCFPPWSPKWPPEMLLLGFRTLRSSWERDLEVICHRKEELVKITSSPSLYMHMEGKKGVDLFILRVLNFHTYPCDSVSWIL